MDLLGSCCCSINELGEKVEIFYNKTTNLRVRKTTTANRSMVTLEQNRVCRDMDEVYWLMDKVLLDMPEESFDRWGWMNNVAGLLDPRYRREEKVCEK